MKNPALKKGKATIYYHDIGDYLTREQKLKMVRDFRSVRRVEWQTIQPNEKNDWINLRDGQYDSLISIAPEKDIKKKNSFFEKIVLGIATSRDVWVYSYSRKDVHSAIESMITNYNAQIGKPENEVDNNSTKISWSANFRRYLSNRQIIEFNPNNIKEGLYRPFQKQLLYYDQYLIERPAQWKNIFPANNYDNMVICVSGMGNNKENPISISNKITDYNCLSAGARCFPLYWYEENKQKQLTLFDDAQTTDKYIRHDGITDWILKEVRSRYGNARNITKEMIFYYVYGILHSPDYRERFAADLKKSLPRIPIVDNVNDFMDFYQYGKKLADLHLNYETVAPCPGVTVHGDRKVTMETRRDPVTGGFTEETTDPSDYDYFRVVDKMRFKSKQDKSTIIYNGNITIENIPAKAYEYIVNGKSAIEWIVERYAVTQDKKSLIRNDANDWSKEHHKPRYILNLLLSVINISVQTVDIVAALPHLKFE